MIFATDSCPICDFKLSLDDTQCQGNYCIKTFYCPNHGFRALSKNMKDMVEVYHYSHREFSDRDKEELVVANMCETIYFPYMIKSFLQKGRSRIYFLPKGDKPAQFIVEVPLLDLDWTDEKEVLKKLKTIIVFS